MTCGTFLGLFPDSTTLFTSGAATSTQHVALHVNWIWLDNLISSAVWTRTFGEEEEKNCSVFSIFSTRVLTIQSLTPIWQHNRWYRASEEIRSVDIITHKYACVPQLLRSGYEVRHLMYFSGIPKSWQNSCLWSFFSWTTYPSRGSLNHWSTLICFPSEGGFGWEHIIKSYFQNTAIVFPAPSQWSLSALQFIGFFLFTLHQTDHSRGQSANVFRAKPPSLLLPRIFHLGGSL